MDNVIVLKDRVIAKQQKELDIEFQKKVEAVKIRLENINNLLAELKKEDPCSPKEKQ